VRIIGKRREAGTEDWSVKDKEPRTVPVCLELNQLLLDAFEHAEPGSGTVIAAGAINVNNISRDFSVLCRRAGVRRYSKPLHTLRKSCLTDWARQFPAHVVKEWAGHASIQTTDEFYLKVSEADYQAAAGWNFGDVTQLVTQPDNSKEDKEKPGFVNPGSESTSGKAGERIRTADVQLGKLAFYH